MSLFAQVLINHPYSRHKADFTYKLPDSLNLQAGHGVLVPFQNQEKAGLILKIHTNKPEFESKMILNSLQDSPLLEPWQMQVAEWISEYYFCSKFDAYRLMLPKHIWRKAKSRTISFKNFSGGKLKKRHSLNESQKHIVKEILNKKITHSLIHGVTGAGKTEIYRHLIEDIVSKGKQALLLVPEIALTPQLLAYFQGHFQNIAVLHSRVSDGQRAAAWKEIKNGKISLLIGSRSALFSPFKNLGIIIMDEEHEWSYKQDSNPRYHAREVAKKISKLTGAKLILGSATPSIESMHEALNGDTKLFSLKERISGVELPKVKVIDLREELKSGNYSILSTALEQKIRSTLAAKEQVILFLNRRGSASSTVCRDCGMAMECPNCFVKMTYHNTNFRKKTLLCHHCGKIEILPDSCSHCGSHKIKHFGIGTEAVEEALKRTFPKAKIARADKDTMNKKNSHYELHEALNNKEIDILIGTQMIGKGFDLPEVSLVGVVLADLGLHIPDFRASERSFQLLTQVAGRSGRRLKRGEVIIQTYNPEHPAIHFSKNHDYLGFYEQEISSRKKLNYPPFSKILKLLFSHPSEEKCKFASDKLLKALKEDAKGHHIFAAPALMPRLNKKYHWNILIHGPHPRLLIENMNAALLKDWRIDVDPLQCA